MPEALPDNSIKSWRSFYAVQTHLVHGHLLLM